ncbi:MAG: hypothetical protein QNM02_15435 [Acidimicrobiia bacterium]|nr:hypothetical protein [Acidimicrobiia bacterium]
MIGCGTHRVEELTADQFDTGDGRLGGLDVLLKDHLAVGALIEVPRGEVSVKARMASEQLDTQTLSALVAFRDERPVELAGDRPQLLMSDTEQRLRCQYPVASEDEILAQLAHLEFESVKTVDDAAPVRLEPIEIFSRELHGVIVASRMR